MLVRELITSMVVRDEDVKVEITHIHQVNTLLFTGKKSELFDDENYTKFMLKNVEYFVINMELATISIRIS